MSQATVRGGFDTWANANRPTVEHHRAKFLNLESGAAEAFIYFRIPAPRGATVTSAKLRLYAHKASSGARTLTVRRVAQSWKARRLNWNNRPGVTGTAITKSIGALTDGQMVEIDVTPHVQTVVNGAANYGWKITTDATTRHLFHSLDSGHQKPTLTVVWSDAPDKPSTLNPSGGIVSVSHPTLQFDYTDVSGNTSLAAVQVQIDPAANETTPAFDSGEVASTVPELDLSTTAYPGLADGATTQWRVRVKDGAGLWSEWSRWEDFSRQSKAAVTVTAPDAGGVTWDVTPDVSWTFGGVQTAFQVRVTEAANRGRVLHDSGKRGGTATAYGIPKGVLADDRTYSLNVRVWDNVMGRTATPGDPIYAEAWIDFQVDDDLAQVPVSTLTATPQGITPWVTLEWTRDLTPTSWTILRDGEVVEALLDPADTLVSGTTHRWTDYTASPHRTHVYNVKAVHEGLQSVPGPTASARTTPEGVWLADPEEGVFVTLWGDDAGTWEMRDEAAVYTPYGSDQVVRIVSAMRGLEGSISGYLMEGFGQTFDDQEAALYALKENPVQVVRLVAGDVNLPVLIGNVSLAPTPRTRDGQVVKDVSLDFWQMGELPFTPRL